MNTNKHAFLIIAHNQPDLLQKLIDLIDDERNDIFIHIDAKSDIKLFNSLKVQKSNLFFTERIKVVWGHINQIKSEMILFKTAHSKNHYKYYHLISGVDLLLKTPNELHDFFNNNDTEYIGFFNLKDYKHALDLRIKYYHILTCFGKNKNKFLRYGASIFRKSFISMQKLSHFQRKIDINYFIGPNWCSITNNCVELLLSHEDEVYKRYRYTICCDEVYKQTIVANSPLMDKVYKCEDSSDQCLREIHWDCGDPCTFTSDDYDILINSKNFFARKFSEQNIDIINKVYTFVMDKKND